MDTIKIFLTSSAELEADRKEFEIFINRRNNEWRKIGIFLHLVVWENFLDVDSYGSWKDEYNKAIGACDIFILLFSNKISKYTEEEFHQAYAQFKATGKPILFIYFKEGDVNTGNITKDIISPLQFKKKLSGLQHFYTDYRTVRELIGDFNNQLDKLAKGGFFNADSLPLSGKRNELALRLIAENKKTKAIRLDLSRCGMEEIPKELSELVWLEELVIGGDTYYDNDKGQFIKTSNTGGFNQFSGLPEGFENLKQLRKLILAGEEKQWLKIRDVSAVGYLANLQSFTIVFASVQDLASLMELTELRELFFKSNWIGNLQPLAKMRKLKRLYFKDNRIVDLTPLKEITTLQELYFENNGVRDLTPLSKLTHLQELAFSGNSVSSLKPLHKLTNLTTIFLNDNQVDDLTPLKNLKHLVELSFINNRVSSLEPLVFLQSLRTFSCSGCPVTDCPTDVYETGDVKTLRGYFDAKRKAEVVDVLRKTLHVVDPPNVKQRNIDGEASDKRRDVKLIVLGNSNSGKTNLVRYLEGAPFSGNRLSTHGLEVHRWLPDAVRFPQLKDIAVSIWDFGGQEYYHDAYRLFLSDNAVYLLLWCDESNLNGRRKTKLKDGEAEVDLEHFDIRYWLDTVRHYGGTQKNTPLVTLQNKVDDPDMTGDDARFYKKRIDQSLHETYGIRESYHISLQQGAAKKDSQPGQTLQHFLEELQYVIAAAADKDVVPPSWQEIRNTIIALKKDQGATNRFFIALQKGYSLWINLADFTRLCNESLVEPLTEDEIHGIPRWLERGGTVVFFPDTPGLEDKVFLQPDKLATRLYEVLDKEVHAKHGEFAATDILPNEKAEVKNVLLQLAQQLNLIFPHPDEKKRSESYFIAPQYLPDSHPIEDLFQIAAKDAWQSGLWVNVPLFYYRKILHGLLLHYAADANTECRYYWKHGIMFMTKAADERNRLRVLIKGLYPNENEHEGVLLIGVENNDEQSQTLKKEIFNTLLALLQRPSTTKRHSKIPSTNNEKFVSANESIMGVPSTSENSDKNSTLDLHVSYDGENYVDYKTLVERARTNEPKVESLNRVWLNMQSFAPILPVPPARVKKVFLSYSHQNTQWLARLRTHLTGLRRSKEIETWDDKEILPGDLWDAAIKKRLAEADVFILLLSADFIASEYIWNEELKTAFDSYKKKGAVIIPVYLEPFDLGGIPGIAVTEDGRELKIGNFEIIPKNQDQQRLVAVSLWQNQEEALAEIARRIREAIKK
jgi:Leucine-rich repeat (LRR) protein/GTPase SAR1 family protein